MTTFSALLPCGPAGRRWRTALLAALLAVLPPAAFHGAAAAGLKDIVARLDKTEWEIVRDEVKERLPSLVMSAEEREMFDGFLETSGTLSAMAEAVEEGNYQGLGGVSASYLADNLGAAIAERYGEGSLFHQVVEFVEDDPALARKLVRAALDADADAARVAIGDTLSEYAAKRGNELRKQGADFWKGMLRGFVPGGEALAARGLDPVDIYFQGVTEWAAFTSRTRVHFNNTALNCLAVRYRVSIERGASPAEAREAVVDLGIGPGMGRDIDCAAELRRRGGGSGRGLLGRLFDMLTGRLQSTAAEGALNLDRSQIADLIEAFEAGHPGRGPGGFANWLEQRLLDEARSRASRLRNALIPAMQREAAEQQELARRVLALVRTAVRKSTTVAAG